MKNNFKVSILLAATSLCLLPVPLFAQAAPYNLELRTRAIDACFDKLAAGEIQTSEVGQCIDRTYAELLQASTNNPSPGTVVPPPGVNCHTPSHITTKCDN